MGRLSGLFQFILGFLLGVVLLTGGTAALGFVFFSRMAAPPPKPLFNAEKQQKDKNANKPAAKAPAKTQTTPKAEEQPVKQESKPEPSPQEEEEKLPPGAYKATVSWSEGLSLRDQAGPDAARTGGIMYNDEIIVLETSADGQWQKVRIPGSGEEGWIKAGNVQKVE